MFTAGVLIVILGVLTLTGCVEMQAVDIRPKSGAVVIDSTDVVYVKDLLAQTAKQYDLEAQKLVSADMIASYEGSKKGNLSGGIVLILLWQYTNPSHLEIQISGPTPVGMTMFSRQIFREVKAKLVQHFGNERVRDSSKAAIGSI